MKKLSTHIDPLPRPAHSGKAAYTAGFILSLTLTIAAFSLVAAYKNNGAQFYSYSHGLVIASLTVLAVAQLVVQSIYFLHLSATGRTKINLYTAIFTAMTLLIIVVGSLWIMSNLNYHMVPRDTTQYTQQNEGIYH